MSVDSIAIFRARGSKNGVGTMITATLAVLDLGALWKVCSIVENCPGPDVILYSRQYESRTSMTRQMIPSACGNFTALQARTLSLPI